MNSKETEGSSDGSNENSKRVGPLSAYEVLLTTLILICKSLIEMLNYDSFFFPGCCKWSEKRTR